jgi:hypothetical protein
MVIDDIRNLLAAPTPAESTTYLDLVDAALTEGYAQALLLEAERRRVERRIDEIVARLAEDGDVPGAVELAALAQRRTSTDESILALRTLLDLLRERRSALRDAA